MAQPANLVRVDDDGYSLFYCHGCGNTLDRDLFWGPAFALPFVARQRAVGPDDWLDPILPDGGVIIDTARRRLLLWGGEAVRMDIPLRRVYLDLLCIVWDGWAVTWLHRGQFALLEALQLPTDRLLARRPLFSTERTLTPLDRLDWTTVIFSVALADGETRLFPLAGDLTDVLNQGPALIADLNPSDGLDALHLTDAWLTPFPTGGVHIDVARRQIGIWSAFELPLVEFVRAQWPGWTFVSWEDQFERQIEATGQRIALPQRRPDELLAEIVRLLSDTATSDGPDALAHVAANLAQPGDAVQVNPLALRHDPQDVPPPTRRQILDAAITTWRAKRTD